MSGIGAYQPLAGRTDEHVAEVLTTAGMWGRSATNRTGLNALTFRRDVTTSDCFDSATDALARACGVLSLLETDENADRVFVEAASAALMLVQIASGHLAVIFDGISNADARRAVTRSGGPEHA